MSVEKKSLGFVVQYYGFRNDMRSLISRLSEFYDLTLFVDERDSAFNIPPHIKIVEMVPQRRGLYNSALKLVYRFFGNRPRSKKSYKSWLDRRYSASDRSLFTRFNYILDVLSVYLPTFVDFDWYVSKLIYRKTDIEGIDQFLTFSDVNNVFFLAQIINSGKRVFTYVYSWDHPGKYFKFSRSKINYLVWNSEIRNDLHELHGVDVSKIRVLGSTQLMAVHDYLLTRKLNIEVSAKVNVVYFAASMGYGPIAEQEVGIARLLAKKLKEHLPHYTLLFRPYPLLKDWSIYDSLLNVDNVVLEDYRSDGKAVVFTDNDVQIKFKNIDSAAAVIHCGSTLGLEASYFDTPVFFICLEELELDKTSSRWDAINNVFNQHHIKKYLKLKGSPNVINSADQIDSVLKILPAGCKSLLDYNRHVAQATKLNSLDGIVSELSQILSS